MKISFTIQIWREGKMHVAYAPQFDVSSCGKNTEEAKKMRTISQILKEAGFEKHNGEWEEPQYIAIEQKELALA